LILERELQHSQSSVLCTATTNTAAARAPLH
jgi:hypothetical protein